MVTSSVAGAGQAPKTGPQVVEKPSAMGGLTDKFDSFLLLLTKQLQNQDPLSPLETNEFTAQLVQFTGVEQAITTNQKLDKLIGIQTGSQAGTAVSYIDKVVEAQSDKIWLADKQARFTYTLDSASDRTGIVILDAIGKPVRISQGETKAGTHSFEWDGKDNDGNRLPPGVYQVQIGAVDDKGKVLPSKVATSGKVTGVEMADGTITLGIGDLKIPFEKVTAVRQATEAAEDDGWF